MTEPDSSDDAEDATDDSSEAAGSEPAPPGFEVSGAVEPGNEVRVETERSTTSSSAITVNGEEVASTGPFGRAEITVPYEEEMNVTIVDSGQSRTFDVPTDAAIEPGDGRRLAATSRSRLQSARPRFRMRRSRSRATRSRRPTRRESDRGVAETAGPADVSVERGAVEGDRTIDVLNRTSSSLTHSCSGSPRSFWCRPTATGSAERRCRSATRRRRPATTVARGWLPVTDEATVTAEVGAETATTTVGNLYLRLTAVVVLVPGLVIGAAVTYFRLVATTERSRWHGRTSLLVALADALAAFSD